MKTGWYWLHDATVLIGPFLTEGEANERRDKLKDFLWLSILPTREWPIALRLISGRSDEPDGDDYVIPDN